jgi:hypothetical protein
MGFVNVLKKIGRGFLIGLRYAQPIVQQVGAALPGPDIFDGIAGVLGVAETVGDLVQQQTGTKLDKLQIALPQVETLIRASEIVSQHDIADEALFSAGCQQVLEGVLKVTKSLKDKDQKVG